MRNYMLAALAASWALIAGQAAAQVTTYEFRGGLYNTANAAAACTLADCTPYTTAQRATLTLTFAAPLAPNLPAADRSADIISYTFSDGIRTTNGPGANAAIATAFIGTNAAGVPISYSLIFQRTPGPPYTVNTLNDPNAHIDQVVLYPASSEAYHNFMCTSRVPPAQTAVTGPGVCDAQIYSAQSSRGLSAAPTVVTINGMAPAAAVPTLSEWAMILFATVLAGGAALYIQRRRQFI